MLHDQDDSTESTAAAPSRRAVLGTGAAVVAAAWVAPQIISAPAASAATQPGANVVAVGAFGTVVSSPDAVNWALQTSGVGIDLEDVAFSPPLGLYTAVGEAGTIITSPDGATWTARTSGATARLRGVAWIPFFGGFFVAVGGLCTVLTSADGVTWTDCSVAQGSAELQSVTSDGVGRIVAVGTTGALVTSTDGTNYILGTDITTVDLQAVRYDPTLARYLAVGDGGEAWDSTDGTTWSAVTTPNTDPNMGLASNPADGFVAVQDAADNVGAATFDGTTWTEGAAVTGHLFAVTWAGSPIDRFVAAGVEGIIATSAHGIFWTPQVSPTSEDLRGITAAV